MSRVDVELIEVNTLRLEQLRMRKPHRPLGGDGHPEQSVALGGLEVRSARGFGEHGLGREAGEHARSRKLDARQGVELFRIRAPDSIAVVGGYGFTSTTGQFTFPAAGKSGAAAAVVRSCTLANAELLKGTTLQSGL